ncbi:TatD DNase family protein [Peptoniphilus koenoeneniae]|uniref:TatD DNase family protein n=1 Tax=Peptoniphilus koenoeneniae TaxID=507751 RepID=A0ABU0AX39_9FIRM|nr:TatD family hydrolase [Peptoniphilus koenoeneniae]MDQ0274998.1 TatD DNase family protein [Peptoniphilus koenoeneniae]
MIDSHAHLDDEKFDLDREELINNLKENGIDRVYNIGADIISSENSVNLANKYDNIFAVVGVHPHEADSYDEKIEKRLEELAKNEKVVGIGEIGLDYYYDNSPRQVQKQVFKRQIDLAAKLKLPIIIHSRDAHKDTFDILKEGKEKYPSLKVLIHCYSSSVEMMREYMKLGFYIALGGAVTFKNAVTPKEVAKEVPLERLLLETDCPYMAPVPLRGKRNEPMFMKYTAKEIAALRNMDVKDLVKQTDKNTLEFYHD